MTKLLPYFSYHGRTNRARYWVTSFVISISFWVSVLVAAAIPVVGWVLGIVCLVLWLWTATAVLARRLHDRNKSGWWLIPMYGPVFVLGALSEVASDEMAKAGLSLLSLPFVIWIIVELGFLKGTVGPNRFGPDPLQPEVAEVFS